MNRLSDEFAMRAAVFPTVQQSVPQPSHPTTVWSILVCLVCWIYLVYSVGKDSRITGVMPAPTVQVMQPILQPQD